jgi:glycosyltransferase involved in cell wall biosynthesis
MRMVDYKPKVSIVIPAYNASNYLAEAIESAMAQTYENIEIIVVNDGSKDNGETANVAEKYKDKIIYIEKENGGSSSALNCGIANMTGEWFSWLSHDDLYYTEKIETQINYMNNLGLEQQELQSHVFFTASELIDENGKCIRTPSPNHEEKVSNQVQTILGNQYLIAEPTKYTFHGCSCLIHRSIFESIGGFDEKLRIVNVWNLFELVEQKDWRCYNVTELLR